MIIYSPKFCAEEFRTVTDLRNQLEVVFKHFKLRVYVMRLTEEYLTDIWIEEFDMGYGPDCMVLQIAGEVKHSKSPPAVSFSPPKWVDGKPHSKINEIVAEHFAKTVEADFGGINGQIPQWAIDSLKIKLGVLEGKTELAVV